LTQRLQGLRKQETALKNAVEEMLRWTTPGSVIPLSVAEDVSFRSPTETTMNGRRIEKGEEIFLAKGTSVTIDLASVNRAQGTKTLFAPGRFTPEDSADFDVSRPALPPAKGHMTFGAGIHFCAGASLAVENAKRMLEGVLRTFPDLTLDGPVTETDGTLFLSLAHMPVRSARLAADADSAAVS
jgi:cytochrome P450